MLNTRKALTTSFLHTVALLLVVGATGATVAAQRSSGTPASTAQEAIMQASNAWALAVLRNDFDAVTRLLADDFTTVQQTPNSVVLLNKTQQLDVLRQSTQTRPEAQRTLENASVRIHGTVGILTAIATYTGKTAQGPLRTQALITEIWVNEGGTWRMTHFQAATAPRRVG